MQHSAMTNHEGEERAMEETVAKTVLIAGDYVLDHHVYEGRRKRYGDKRSTGVRRKLEVGGAALIHRLLIPPLDGVDPKCRPVLTREYPDADYACEFLEWKAEEEERRKEKAEGADLPKKPTPPKLTPHGKTAWFYAIHENYREEQKYATPPTDPAMQPWAELDEHLRDTNYGQADDIGAKLRAIGDAIVSAEDGTPGLASLTEEEVAVMARMEHGRWTAQKLLAGWRHGKVKDAEAKTNPCILAWDDLPDNERQKDIDTVKKIPRFLAEIGCEVGRPI
jgi:hypothetical protein